MLLGNLLESVNKKYKKINIKGISCDSRTIKKGDVFFAIRGKKISGIKFIDLAITKGAVAIVSDKKIKYRNKQIPLFFVKDVRKSLSKSCSIFYYKKPKNIVAVTGTNGKSSVTDFFYQILSLNKISAASIGTLGVKSKNYKKKTKLTSMEPISLHKNLQFLAQKKINNVILEASSHGLTQRRIDNLNIKTGIFTNLSHDHLDYHIDMKSYLNAKMHLFKKILKKNSIIITSEENKEYNVIKKIALKKKIKKLTIGSRSGDIRILSNKYNKNEQLVKILFKSKIFLLKIPLIGFFQVKNLLMAYLAAYSCGLNKNFLFKQINKIKSVPGRLECIANLKNNCNIIIDFAHTPDALEQSLIALKKQFKKKIILVFGCGGDRDKKKRLSMGKIAEKYCYKIIVTDDNPRNENPVKIRKSIIKGCKNIAVDIGDRKKAIETAIKNLEPNELLLISGKGHEETQDYGNKTINFSDKKIVKKIIKKRKNSFKEFNWSTYISNKVFSNKKNNYLNYYDGVSIDTRTIKKNNLFFAIKGKNNDGHNHISAAIKNGANKCIVSKNLKKISTKKIIKVKNTFSTLNDLAKATRNASSAKIIGITGSVGKTTLKNLISFSLKNYGEVHHSPQSYNNKFGVPLSLANLKKNTQYGVFEIGMDKKGEIHNLSKIVKPEIGVITNISEAHLKNFKTLKDIARAKSEIIDNISKNGSIILNKDDEFFSFFYDKAKKNRINIISFSVNKKADVHLLGIKKNKNIHTLTVSVNNKIFHFYTKNYNKNYLSNILACIAVLTTLSLDLGITKNLFVNFKVPEGRGDMTIVKKFKKEFKLIDESYNANPLSMISAIRNIRNYKRKKNEKKLVLLGDMLELGKKSKKLHISLSSEINKSDIDKIFVYGRKIKETFAYLLKKKKGKVFKNLKEANEYLKEIINNGDFLMIKGSNATGLNTFTKKLKGNK